MLTKKTRDTRIISINALFSKQGIPDWSPMFVLTPARTSFILDGMMLNLLD